VLEREKRQLHLAAQTVREIGILIVVFAPLDAFFHDNPPAPIKVMPMVVMGLTAIIVGIRIESEREG
jgi:hypothetical protein